MQRPDNQLQIRIKECENPTFGYRRGEDGEIEKDVFDGEPLPDGWVDSPAKVDEQGKRPALSFRTISTAEPAPHHPPHYKARGFQDLQAEYKRRTGKGPKPSVNRLALIEMLKDLDARNQE